ncbi:MAG: GNAT family N-acetyltransferase [Acidobacteria bacterium]|nr:GNAT family N-acetyltransferase [Acidobacteriota bacterium]
MNATVTTRVVLETPRLLLREFADSDAHVLAQVLSDAATMLWYPAPLTEDQVAQWIAGSRRRYASDGFGLWAMVRKATGELIGDCGITMQAVDGELMPEVGYHVRRDCWGCGYATEAARACFGYGFSVLGLDAIISLIRPENVQSRRVAQKNGLRAERQTLRAGVLHDVWLITRDEFMRLDLSACSE